MTLSLKGWWTGYLTKLTKDRHPLFTICIVQHPLNFRILYYWVGISDKNSYGDTRCKGISDLACKGQGTSPEPATKAILQGEFTPNKHWCYWKAFQHRWNKLCCDWTDHTGNIQGSVWNRRCCWQSVPLGIGIPMEYIDGLQTASLTSVLIPGEDEEDTEVFQTALLWQPFNEQSLWWQPRWLYGKGQKYWRCWVMQGQACLNRRY